MPEKLQRPKDPNQLAKMLADIATGEIEEAIKPDESNAYWEDKKLLNSN